MGIYTEELFVDADTRKTLAESLAAFRNAWTIGAETMDLLTYADLLADDVERALELEG